MIGPFAAVLGHPTAKFRIREHQHSLVVAGLGQPGKHVQDRLTDLIEEPLVHLGLARVRVEAVQGDVKDPRAKSFLDQFGNEVDLHEQAILRVAVLVRYGGVVF